MNPTVNITLIGPESTGKTTLARQLADHFQGTFVSEFARAYLEARTDHVYEFSDLEAIAKGQLQALRNAKQDASNLIFADTDLITLHIWALDKFDRPIPFVEEALEAEKADLYLLCKPDIAGRLLGSVPHAHIA